MSFHTDDTPGPAPSTRSSPLTARRSPATCSILSCGVSARTDLAVLAGLRVAGGILVGEDLRSWSDDRVYAIGDCAQVTRADRRAPRRSATSRARPSGLIGPGWRQAEWLAARFAEETAGHRRRRRTRRSNARPSSCSRRTASTSSPSATSRSSRGTTTTTRRRPVASGRTTAGRAVGRPRARPLRQDGDPRRHPDRIRQRRHAEDRRRTHAAVRARRRTAGRPFGPAALRRARLLRGSAARRVRPDATVCWCNGVTVGEDRRVGTPGQHDRRLHRKVHPRRHRLRRLQGPDRRTSHPLRRARRASRNWPSDSPSPGQVEQRGRRSRPASARSTTSRPSASASPRSIADPRHGLTTGIAVLAAERDEHGVSAGDGIRHVGGAGPATSISGGARRPVRASRGSAGCRSSTKQTRAASGLPGRASTGVPARVRPRITGCPGRIPHTVEDDRRLRRGAPAARSRCPRWSCPRRHEKVAVLRVDGAAVSSSVSATRVPCDQCATGAADHESGSTGPRASLTEPAGGMPDDSEFVSGDQHGDTRGRARTRTVRARRLRPGRCARA